LWLAGDKFRFSESFFDAEILKSIQNETNLYVVQQIKKKEQEGPLKEKESVFAHWETCHITGTENVLCSCHSLVCVA
jgi:hypothetical protein